LPSPTSLDPTLSGTVAGSPALAALLSDPAVLSRLTELAGTNADLSGMSVDQLLADPAALLRLIGPGANEGLGAAQLGDLSAAAHEPISGAPIPGTTGLNLNAGTIGSGLGLAGSGLGLLGTLTGNPNLSVAGRGVGVAGSAANALSGSESALNMAGAGAGAVNFLGGPLFNAMDKAAADYISERISPTFGAISQIGADIGNMIYPGSGTLAEGLTAAIPPSFGARSAVPNRGSRAVA
jgi:hypothetical protein